MNVELLDDTSGGDVAHALSAWTSTRRELTPERRNRMKDMLFMLARSDPPHTTPFEKSYIHFLVRCDNASHIHIIKHRIGVSVNAESARYKELTPSHHIPDDWPPAERAALNAFASEAESAYHACLNRLERHLGRKRAKESARYYLTYANELTLDVSFNFNSFVHFVKLRGDESAQKEIRDITSAMVDDVRKTGMFDISLEAFGI